MPIGTRIALYYILCLLVLIGGNLLGLLALGGPELVGGVVEQSSGPPFRVIMAIQVLTAPLILLATYLFVRFRDRKSLASIGFGWPRPWQVGATVAGVGVVLGAWLAIVGTRVDVRFASGDAPLDGTAALPDLATPRELVLLLLGLLIMACWEEWIARGYIYSTLREKLAWVHASGITALLFVLLHWQDPDIGAAGLINVFLFGMISGALRELTGSLWTVVVFHGAWNFLLGCILSLPVNGIAFPSLYQTTVAGAAEWSGGTYGPEGSWLMTGLLVAVIVGLAALLHEDEDDSAETDESDETAP